MPEDAEDALAELEAATGPAAALNAVKTALGPRDPECGHTAEDFARLVRSFSTMGILPEDILLPHFDVIRFDKWMGDLHAGGNVYDRRTVTASFVAHAYTVHQAKNFPPFDCKLAIELWSPPDYRAFLRWVIRPWRG